MKREKYATIDVETENNIGVVNLGEVTLEDFKFSTENEQKVVKALSEHFDLEIKVRSVIIKTVHPITVEMLVLVCSEEEDYVETVTLNETWVY